MLGVLVLAPLIGLVWGVVTKRIGWGLVLGLLVGGGNYVLWTVYNAITERLGLDTVNNLLVNLGLFVILGSIVGIGAGLFAARQRPEQTVPEGELAETARQFGIDHE